VKLELYKISLLALYFQLLAGQFIILVLGGQLWKGRAGAGLSAVVDDKHCGAGDPLITGSNVHGIPFAGVRTRRTSLKEGRIDWLKVR
jgi:hypothetical protein